MKIKTTYIILNYTRSVLITQTPKVKIIIIGNCTDTYKHTYCKFKISHLSKILVNFIIKYNIFV